jgi:tellurite resistance protein TehA-like permease
MVFPLGMYSTCSQALGHALGAGWMVDIGRWWLLVAIAAWLAVAVGELNRAISVSFDA